MCRKLTWLVSLVLLLGLGHSASAQWKASNPIPPDGATGVSPNVTLYWDPAYGYLSSTYDVYLGTNYDAVYNANTFDPEFLGNVDSNEYNPSGPLDFDQTYYWRADTVVPHARHKGTVWSFTTMSTPLGLVRQ